MKTIIILFVSLLPLLCFWGCTDASSPGYEDPADPAVAPRIVWAWLDSPRHYYREWDKQSSKTDTLPIGYYPGRLMIRFNKIMVGYTVLPNVSLLPSEEGFAQLYASAGFSGDGQTFEFPINGMFKVAKPYIIVVKKEVTDVTNLKLESDYRKEIIPEPEFRIINSSPAQNDTNVYQSQSIYIFFNSCIDTNTILDNITFSPPLKGKWYQSVWSRYELSFRPDSVLKSNTVYQVTISTGLRDSDGNNLRSPFLLRFRTTPFRVSSTYPFDGQQNVYPTEWISCYFTINIDTSSVKNSFTITPSTAGTFQFSYYYPSNYFYFKPSGILLSNTTYTITLSTPLKSISADTMTSPYIFSFKTIQ
ncbi:MAG: Ig-like domain-containing protein [Ignavibacteriales bacterium]|nr:Ig-like domain-containing protein [Ignavibacteriales bacterium]